MTKHLLLLPGLDGTGQLFADFVAALPSIFTATIVAYPPNEILSYDGLSPFVSSAAPKAEPFVLLAESFSTPLALDYAASNPPNLTAVIICTGFVFKPLARWSQLAKAVARPWFFRLRAPNCILEYFLVGRDAPTALIQELRETLRLVSPEVLSARVCEALNCDARNALARTTVPLMYVQATQDRLLAESCVNEMKRIKPDILIAQVVGPHLLLQRESQKVADIVSTFVQAPMKIVQDSSQH
jgi:pimeloyl-[acyl-carrier protein] methyl ester esterase